ncbi:DMT family transporter [Pandoraea sp.]|uniref:DMT family transporter n=1 Tax=Pandoraea sp. TaxID=1883445 RepID=UPI0011FC0B3C|nr:DMT family transporter [Pandoraea sp.]TAL52374.1 MAG: EamA/RhaT family transporter [Pandoraea sp.]TAM16184.1 MAG: EamA/RhaT family transporter [Pandoraea sp.]
MRPADFTRMIALSAIWGASFLFMRIAAPVLGALPTAFFRVLFGALGLAVLLAAMRVRWRFNGKFGATLALGAINSGVPFIMYCLAAEALPAGYSAILNATTPLMGVLIGALLFGERLTPPKVLAMVLGLAGVGVLTRAGPVALTPTVLLGAGACLVATACYGLAGFLTRRWITEKGGLDSKLVAFGSQLGAILLVLPFFAVSSVTGPAPDWGTPGVWAAMAGLGFMCTALAYILYFRLIADIGPIKSLTVTFLIPLFGVLWGALFLGERLSWAHAFGGGLIGAALWLVLRPAGVATRLRKAA